MAVVQHAVLVFVLLALTTATPQLSTAAPPPTSVVVTTSEASGSSDDSEHCVCKIITPNWSELAEYRKLDEMRNRLKIAESLLAFMNFSTIFENLENATARLNDLEAGINKQAISASVTELFALRRNVENLVNIVESSNSSAMVAEQRGRLVLELDAISKVVDDLWERNPYRQRDDYKNEVAKLRERFSSCHSNLQLSPFDGDTLPLGFSLLEGWCPSDEMVFNLGRPMTHKWTGSEHKKGMWFKDPQPLTNTNRTEIWNIIYETYFTNNHYNRRTSHLRKSLKKFLTYIDLINDKPTVESVDSNIRGYGAVIFRNSLYYNADSRLVKYDLTSHVKTTVVMGFESVEYTGSSESTYLDLKVDESGLWVVYSISSDKKLAISKLDPVSLIVKKTWMTEVIKSDVCAAFMVCGKLYTIRSCGSRLAPSNLNYVFDTSTSMGHFIRYHVPSMYGAITQVTYNPRERMLFAWDNGHMVTYTVGWGEGGKNR